MRTKPQAKAPPKRRTRLWRAVRYFLLFVVLPPILAAFLLEFWRQNEIRVARNEVLEEYDYIAERYKHVEDFPAWYRQRLNGSVGERELRQLCAEDLGELKLHYPPLPDEIHVADTVFMPDPLKEMSTPHVDDIDAIIVRGRRVQIELAALRRFDHLLGAPDQLTYKLGEVNDWLDLVWRRALFFARLGKWDAAAEAAVVAFELASRMQNPANIRQWALVTRNALSVGAMVFRSLGGRLRFTEEQAERLLRAAHPSTYSLRDFLDGHFAEHAWAYREFGTGITARYTEDRWFYWLTNSWSGAWRGGKFGHLDYADSLYAMRPVLDAVHSGTSIPPPTDRMLYRVSCVPEQSRLNLRAQQLRALATLRLAQLRGSEWASLTLDTTAFPDIALAVTNDQATIGFRRHPSTLTAADLDSWEKLDIYCPAIEMVRHP